MTTAHIDSLVFSWFSEGTVLMEGKKMRSTFFAARLRRCPCTSLAGKQTVSEVTAESPLSYILRVLKSDSWTVKTECRKEGLPKRHGIPEKEHTRQADCDSAGSAEVGVGIRLEQQLSP